MVSEVKTMKSVSRPVGRRLGKSGARENILNNARAYFAKSGYEHTTIRGVARAADVDPALVMHYFRSKYELFLESMLPTYQGPGLLQEALKCPRDEFGHRIAALFGYLMETNESHEILLGMVRASASEPKAAEIMREFIEHNLLKPMSDFIGGPDADLKAGLIGSQMVGLFVTKYIVKLEPLASASSGEIAAILAPVIQVYA
jgi:AcrR family transcriptional regulator